MKKEAVRVRIAPSPTGYLHFGTARTALFNWLFAKKHGGVFILRIEDTDAERSKKEYEDDIKNELTWLGLTWDEFYRQSERADIYERYLKDLIEKGLAYFCFCTREELERERENQMIEGMPPRYNGRCRSLTGEEVAKLLNQGKQSVIRFKMPEAEISFTDLIRGKVDFLGSEMGDIVIAKNLHTPLYNFAATVDDFEMGVSHVIRAEDHLSNTPKQIAMARALGFPETRYAHLPLILNPDRSKMSKRFTAAALREYRKQGYLPQAIINFMVLLGWHPEGDREIFSIGELIHAFDLSRVQKSGAVFNLEKLDWLNGHYLRELDSRTLMLLIKETNGMPDSLTEKQAQKAVNAVKERLRKLSDFPELAGFFFELPDYEPALLIWKESDEKNTAASLKEIAEALERVPQNKFTAAGLADFINPITETRGRGEVLWPLRVALSGKNASPGPFEIMDVLDKQETLNRIKAAIEKLESGS